MSQSATTAGETAGAVGLARRARALVARFGALLLGGGDRATDRRNALVAFSVRIASAAILFLSQVALARWMGADQFGIYVYAWTLVLVLGGISTAGLNVGAIRIVSELRERAAHDALRGFLLGSRVAVALVATTLTGLVAALVWKLAAPLAGSPWLTVSIILLAVPAYALTDLQDGICRGCARIASALLAPYIIRPLLILGGIGALHAAGYPLDAASAISSVMICSDDDCIPKNVSPYSFGSRFMTLAISRRFR